MHRTLESLHIAGGLVFATVFAACTPSPEPEIPLRFMEFESPAGAGATLPHLASRGGTTVLSWVAPAGTGHRLQYARLAEREWSAPILVAEGSDWFVNWADFPAVVPIDEGYWVAHWLERNGDRPYAYDIAVATSDDHGLTWTARQRPHRDGLATEHGFVTAIESQGTATLIWLDGRQMGEGASHDDSAAHGAMALATAEIRFDGAIAPEQLLDRAVCDCCQTDAATTPRGTLVVYRDREIDSERRDIAVMRRTRTGWSDPVLVHADNWVMRGCPVNGPAIDATGEFAAVAWFTAAERKPRVRIAMSRDGGDTFAAPVDLDGNAPLGRVDIVALPDGSVLVSWLAREAAESALHVARVSASDRIEGPWRVAHSSGARSAGFPQMIRSGEVLVLAWTEDSEPARIRTVLAELPLQWLVPVAPP